MDYIFRWMAVKFIGEQEVVSEAGDTQVLRATEPDPQQALPFGKCGE